MKTFTFIFVTVISLGFFHLLQASPIGKVNYDQEITVTTPVTEVVNSTTTEVALANSTVIDTLTTEIDVANGNDTHIRQKRSCGCGCCCCRPCCCCCRPCCCCCRPCCCCCRCCCCCCRPCCCCCCRPCCCGCGGCGCCGCGGRKRRSIQQLSHKLMDKQAELIRQYSESAEVSTTTTEAPTTIAPFTNSNIDAYGRSYGNLAFADFTNNINPASNINALYNQQ